MLILRTFSLLALLVIPTSAFSELYNRLCVPPDTVEIRDDGPDKAIVTYYNSSNECSQELNITLTSPNGIAVKIHITLGGQVEEYREIINLVPENEQMMAFPPEGKLIDGETQEFIIMGGLS